MKPDSVLVSPDLEQPAPTARRSADGPLGAPRSESAALRTAYAPARPDQSVIGTTRAATSALEPRVSRFQATIPSDLSIVPGRGLRRSQRALLLLLAVWWLNVFDLGFTLHQARSEHFVEKNPLAARLLDAPPAALFVYKFSLLTVGTVILVILRRHAVAELACWFLLAAYFYVAVRWFVYYERLADFHADELVIAAT